MGRVAVRVKVYGKVQGVFFRSSMKEVADRLGVDGWVKNMSDGTVEAVVAGEEEKVREVVEWCRRGPPLAKVTKVETYVVNENLAKKGFSIVY